MHIALLTFFSLTTTLLPGLTKSECLSDPNRRLADFVGCDRERVYPYSIVKNATVHSAVACGFLCLENQHCRTFNVRGDSKSEHLFCQLSSDHLTNCSGLVHQWGGRTYRQKVKAEYCANPWRLALKTVSGVTVQGSVADLRDAILRGAKVHVSCLPDPLDTYYHGWLVDLDTAKVSPGGDAVLGYSYVYLTSTYDSPHWALFKVNSSGSMELLMSNSSRQEKTSVTLSWVVQEPYTPCFQSSKLSHRGPISSPVLSFALPNQIGKTQDAVSSLLYGSAARAVSDLGGEGTLAYGLYDLAVSQSGESLRAKATWIPADPGRHLPLRVHDMDTTRSGFEMYTAFNTSDSTPHSMGLAEDPSLARTDVFLDPCWTLQLAVDENGDIQEGGVEEFVTSVQSGAAVTVVYMGGTDKVVMQAEIVEVDDYGQVRAMAKMGTTQDDGMTWDAITATVDGEMYFGDSLVSGAGDILFYTDNRLRGYRYTWDTGKVVEGDFSGVLARLKAGLIPRVSVTLESSTQYLEIEAVDLGSDPYSVFLKCYREPRNGGFAVFHIGLDGYIRVDVGHFRDREENLVPANTSMDVLVLFFEEIV